MSEQFSIFQVSLKLKRANPGSHFEIFQNRAYIDCLQRISNANVDLSSQVSILIAEFEKIKTIKQAQKIYQNLQGNAPEAADMDYND